MFKQAHPNDRTTPLSGFSSAVFTAAILALSIGFSGCARETTPSSASTEATATTEATSEFSAAAQPVGGTEPENPATDAKPNPGPVAQTTLPKPGEFQVLVTVLETGGMCAGPCGNVQTVLYSDGTWTQGLAIDPNQTVTATTLPPKHGQLDIALAQKIAGAIRSTTATELQALPVTQQYCPSAADGRDLSFTYRLDGVEVALSNCTINLREANPLVHLTSEALDKISETASSPS